MKELVRRMWVDDNGQDLAEYAMLLGLVLAITAAVISNLGTKVNSVFTAVVASFK